MDIHVRLADREVGTKAVVTERKWFRTKVSMYVCVSATKLGGGEWVNEETGESVDLDMYIALNRAAQAAAMCRNMKGI